MPVTSPVLLRDGLFQLSNGGNVFRKCFDQSKCNDDSPKSVQNIRSQIIGGIECTDGYQFAWNVPNVPNVPKS